MKKKYVAPRILRYREVIGSMIQTSGNSPTSLSMDDNKKTSSSLYNVVSAD